MTFCRQKKHSAIKCAVRARAVFYIDTPRTLGMCHFKEVVIDVTTRNILEHGTRYHKLGFLVEFVLSKFPGALKLRECGNAGAITHGRENYKMSVV